MYTTCMAAWLYRDRMRMRRRMKRRMKRRMRRMSRREIARTLYLFLFNNTIEGSVDTQNGCAGSALNCHTMQPFWVGP